LIQRRRKLINPKIRLPSPSGVGKEQKSCSKEQKPKDEQTEQKVGQNGKQPEDQATEQGQSDCRQWQKKY
jgi:hypothetical protein